MNHSKEQIVSVLQHAPRPQPPPGLRERLLGDLPRSQVRVEPSTARPPGGIPPSWWRRWWPAVAGSGLACACLAVVGVQEAEIRTLQAEIRRLKSESAAPGADPSRAGASARPRPEPAVVEVPLSDGPGELARLRTEVSAMNSELAELNSMQAENERLRTRFARESAVTAEETAAFNEARERAQRLVCVNNLKQLGLAARIWATDNGDVLPPDVLSMANEIAAPKVLICPADEGRQPAPDWVSFSTANLSYQYLAASGLETEPQRVMFVCPIHHNVTLCDGSVQQLSAERFAAMVQRDGKLYFEYSPGPQGVIDPRTGMDRRMMQRYGLLPPGEPVSDGNATAPSQLQMSPELMKRYGLLPPSEASAPAPDEEQSP